MSSFEDIVSNYKGNDTPFDLVKLEDTIRLFQNNVELSLIPDTLYRISEPHDSYLTVNKYIDFNYYPPLDKGILVYINCEFDELDFNTLPERTLFINCIFNGWILSSDFEIKTAYVSMQPILPRLAVLNAVRKTTPSKGN